MRCRKNVKNLTPDEKKRFAQAVMKLKDAALHPSTLHPGSQSRYDDYCELHKMAMMAEVDSGSTLVTPGWAHRAPAFFPWHRELLYRFELDLQSIDPDITIPYWDWCQAQTSASPGWPFTYAFLGPNGSGADHRVHREPGAPSPYPHGFDPDNWTILVKDNASDPDFLNRNFGSDPTAPNLPPFSSGSGSEISVLGRANYDASPWQGNTGATSFRAGAEISLHNLVHRWVSGTMLLMTSPNDPVFFLHHANIDRLWNIWEARHAAASQYLPATGATTGHNLNDNLIFNDSGDPAPWSGSIRPADLVHSHTIHGSGVWYESDLPEITPETTSIDFGNVPETLTTYRAARFHVRTCRRAKFRITAPPASPFFLPAGTEFFADPVASDDFVNGYVWIAYTSAPGVVPPSSVTIQPYISDDDAEYTGAAGADVFIGPPVTVTLLAASVARADNAVALVLDRSGSMAASAGGSATRSSLLRNAVRVFAALLRPTDKIGLVSFDDVVDTLTTPDLIDVGPSLATINGIADGPGLDPRNFTGIGAGIQRGHDVLMSAPAGFNRAMLVFTDGLENVHPYIDELPMGTIDALTYAIGFGRANEVDLAKLQEITTNTHGDLVVTGDFDASTQQFFLTKYFVQVLAGITKTNVILDPQGELFYGSEQVIAFQVADSDVSLDVILLSTFPEAIEFALRTPGGDLISGSAVNVQLVVTPDVAYYRIVLPAMPARPETSHGGKWHVLLKLRDEREIVKLIRKADRDPQQLFSQHGGLPYSIVVQADSNLTFLAGAVQHSHEPGAAVELAASLTEYDVPFAGSVNVWAEVTLPGGATMTATLAESAGSQFSATFVTTAPGVYAFRLRAEGATSRGVRFTREKTATAGVWVGGDRPAATDDHACGCFCRLMRCLFGQETFVEWMKKLGLPVGAFHHCLAALCAHTEPVEPGRRTAKRTDAARPARIATIAQPQPRKGERVAVAPKTKGDIRFVERPADMKPFQEGAREELERSLKDFDKK